VRQWRDDHAGVLELLRYVGCLSPALGLASAHALVHGTASPAEFLAALKRVAPPPQLEQLEVGAKVELHSLNATEHNGKNPGSGVAGRGTSGSRSGRGWCRRGAGRAEFAGRRAGDVQFGGGFLSDSGRTVSAGVGHV
jgi:hypothetical protein